MNYDERITACLEENRQRILEDWMDLVRIPSVRGEPAMEMPAGRGGAHQRDEAIGIDDFFLAVRILMQYVLACDRLLND